MEIKYEKSRFRNNLYYGILMLVSGLIIVFISDTLSVFRFLWVLLGILHLGSAWYYKRFPYLIIDNKTITKHSLYPASIEIGEITRIWKMANSYRIETSDKTLTIEKHVMEPESISRLADYLNQLELKDFRVEGAKIAPNNLL